MPYFSNKSMDRLITCVQPLQRLFIEVIRHEDCSILEGHRGEYKQHKYFIEGVSKVDWPNGNHNPYPSLAVDAVPYPLDWELVRKDDKRAIQKMYLFIGKVLGIAVMMDIPVISGADWDGDGEISDQQFHDLPHFQMDRRRMKR